MVRPRDRGLDRASSGTPGLRDLTDGRPRQHDRPGRMAPDCPPAPRWMVAAPRGAASTCPARHVKESFTAPEGSTSLAALKTVRVLADGQPKGRRPIRRQWNDRSPQCAHEAGHPLFWALWD